MNIQEGNYFWNMDTGIIKKYEYLASNKKCDTLIIGGGIAGALTAYVQAKAGAHVIVVDKNILGYGETLCNLGVLQKCMDITRYSAGKKEKLHMIKRYNSMCDEAVEDVINIINEIKKDETCKKYIEMLNLKEVDLLYYSNKITQKYLLYKMFERNMVHNKEIEYVEEDELINLRAGIVIPKKAVILNPYILASLIYLYLFSNNKIEIYENTCIENINSKENEVECITSNRFKICAKSVILTSKQEALKYISEENAENFEVYKRFTIVTEPVKMLKGSNANLIVKKVGNEDITLVFTKDNRVMLNGLSIKETEKRIEGNYLKITTKGKYKRLYYKLGKELNMEFNPKICKCFYRREITTKDGMPVIDELNNKPNVYLNLGASDNIMVGAMIGAKILKDISKKNYIKEMYLFRENR